MESTTPTEKQPEHGQDHIDLMHQKDQVQTPTSKRCMGPCDEVKLLDKFNNQKWGKYGKTSKCKECRRTEATIRAAAKTGNSPKDVFFAALAVDRKVRGVQYSTMSDAWRILTAVLGYKKQP